MKSKSRVQDAVVQDRCPDTVLANNGPTADDLTVMRIEVAVAAAARVGDGEKVAKEAVVVEAMLVQDSVVKKMAKEEMVMKVVQVCQLHEG